MSTGKNAWAATALTCAAAAAVLIPAMPATAALRSLTVVASGDSYASGEGAIELGRGWTNAACHRSNLAAPKNAADRLIAAGHPTVFSSVACSGASTASMLGPGGQLGALPVGPIDALTMSIGGNDIGFAGIVGTCITGDCTTLDRAVTRSLAALPARLAAVFAAVPMNVANVFVTEYPDPTTGLLGIRCGNPLMPGFQGFELIDETEATWASTRLVARLNAALATAVAVADALPGPRPVFHFVTGISSRFATHGYCTGGGSTSPLTPATWLNPRYVNTPLDSVTSQLDPMGSMHPNDVGQQVIGEVLHGALSFLGDPLTVSVATSMNPAVVNNPVTVTVTARTSTGTPVPGAPVLLDGVRVGLTDQLGTLTTTLVFATYGVHVVAVDRDPYPTVNRGIQVLGSQYQVSADPYPIPVDRPVTLTMRATDAAGQLVPGTFTLVSGTGQASLQSGQSALVSLTVRYQYVWERDGDGKPVRVRKTICPEVTFQPGNPAFPPRDVSDLVDCVDS